MGVGAIPWASVDRWAERHGIEGEDFDVLWRLIRSMDQVYLEHHDEKQRPREGPKAWGPGRGRNHERAP